MNKASDLDYFRKAVEAKLRRLTDEDLNFVKCLNVMINSYLLNTDKEDLSA